VTDQTPDQITAMAEQEAAEAEQLLDALEERVRAGDDTVTPTQVEEARGLRRFAQLRREAAQRKAEAAKKAETNTETARRRDAFLSAYADCNPDLIKAAAQRAEEALFELLELVDRHDSLIYATVPQLASPVCAASDLRVSASHQYHTVSIDGTVYARIGSQSVANQAMNSAANRHMHVEHARQAARPA
jgi:hypothetical protein